MSSRGGDNGVGVGVKSIPPASRKMVQSLKGIVNCPEDDLKDSPTDFLPSNWDDKFGDSGSKSDDELDPRSWRPIFEPDLPESINTRLQIREMQWLYDTVTALVKIPVDGDGEIETLAAVQGVINNNGDDPLVASSGQVIVGVESWYRVNYKLVNSI